MTVEITTRLTVKRTDVEMKIRETEIILAQYTKPKTDHAIAQDIHLIWLPGEIFISREACQYEVRINGVPETNHATLGSAIKAFESLINE